MALKKVRSKKELEAFRKKENERKRLWKQKKRFEQQQVQTSHFTGKKKIQFKKDEPAPPVLPQKAPTNRCRADERPLSSTKKHLRFRWRAKKKFDEMSTNNHSSDISRKTRKAFDDIVPEAHEPEVISEQVEKPQTTKHCPESIKEDGLREVKKNPEYYIEINMVTKNRVVDTFFIPAEKKKIHYKTKEYVINEEAIYLLPTKLGLFMPTCYYKEGTYEPRGFKQMNKGITGKALSLLYMEQLYTSLLYSDEVKYNFFIVILSIAILICYGVGCYFLFINNGGLLPKDAVPLPPIDLIFPWRI